MVLNNYCKMFGTTSTPLINPVGESGVSVGIDSPHVYIMGGRNYEYRRVTSMDRTFVDVGFGDTPETPDDYVLADGNSVPVKNSGYVDKSEYHLTQVGGGYNAHTGNREFFSEYTNFRNDTNQNIIVKEVGVYGQFGSTNVNQAGLIMRKVLDNPITIAPGESYSFTYRLRIKDN